MFHSYSKNAVCFHNAQILNGFKSDHINSSFLSCNQLVIGKYMNYNIKAKYYNYVIKTLIFITVFKAV